MKWISVILIASAKSEELHEWCELLRRESGLDFDWRTYAGRYEVYFKGDRDAYDAAVYSILRTGVPGDSSHMWLTPDGVLMQQPAKWVSGDEPCRTLVEAAMRAMQRERKSPSE